MQSRRRYIYSNCVLLCDVIRHVADMQQMWLYQKCHDPDCKRVNYRSAGVAIPVTALESSVSKIKSET